MADMTNRGSSFSQPQAGRAAGDFRSAAQETAAGVAGRASQAWDAAQQQVGDLTSRVTAQAGPAWETVQDFMGRYPIPMFLAGMGLGFLLARAFDAWPADIPSRMARGQ